MQLLDLELVLLGILLVLFYEFVVGFFPLLVVIADSLYLLLKLLNLFINHIALYQLLILHLHLDIKLLRVMLPLCLKILDHLLRLTQLLLDQFNVLLCLAELLAKVHALRERFPFGLEAHIAIVSQSLHSILKILVLGPQLRQLVKILRVLVRAHRRAELILLGFQLLAKLFQLLVFERQLLSGLFFLLLQHLLKRQLLSFHLLNMLQTDHICVAYYG